MTRLIIDGYNLLSIIPLKDREQLVAALVRYKKAKRHQVTIVFDGTHQGTGFGDEYRQGGIEVVFTPLTVQADDKIEEMLFQDLKGRENQVVVISSDRRLIRAAEKVGATSISSDVFAEKLDWDGKSDKNPRWEAIEKWKGVPPWLEGRDEDEDSAPLTAKQKRKMTAKKGSPKKLSKKERQRRQKLKKL